MYWTTKKEDSRFWFVNDQGQRCLSIGLNSLEPGDNLSSKYASKAEWASAASQLMIDHGFNTVGAFGNESIPGLPYTPLLSFLGGFTKEMGQEPKNPKQLLLVKKPEFADYCYQKAALLCNAGDPHLIGYFLDNELNWNNQLSNFRALVETYFSVVSRAIKSVDQNHLLLGCRFHRPSFGRKVVFELTGQYNDVVSINYYGVDQPKADQVKQWWDWCQKPMMVSEMYAMAMNGEVDGLQCSNSSGAGKIVQSQQNRAGWYQNFMNVLYNNKYIIGNHWFRYMDDPSSGGSNKGIVGIKFTPYSTLLDKMKLVHAGVPK